jgi:hypothetical protein
MLSNIRQEEKINNGFPEGLLIEFKWFNRWIHVQTNHWWRRHIVILALGGCATLCGGGNKKIYSNLPLESRIWGKRQPCFSCTMIVVIAGLPVCCRLQIQSAACLAALGWCLRRFLCQCFSDFGYILVLSPSDAKKSPFTNVDGDSFEYPKCPTPGFPSIEKIACFWATL